MIVMKYAAKINTESLISKPAGLKRMFGSGKNVQ